MQYKIGDHVVIEKSNIECMSNYAGKTGVITHIDNDPRHSYRYYILVDDNSNRIWCDVKCLVEEVKGNEVMKCKFKVGDKVRIVRNTGNMVVKNKYIGQIHTISSIDPNREFCYSLKNGNGWAWREDDLELVVCQDKIVITTDGKTTTATLYHDDMKTVATARCAPEDTFDFNVGAELAMKRLMEAVNPVTVGGFKVGDRVNYGGHNGTVICLVDGGDYPIGVEFDTPNIGFHDCKGFTLASGNYGTKGNSRWFDSDELTHGEAPKYYNGKVVCVDVILNKGLYTLGKIYEFVDGTFTCDDGTEVHTWRGNVRFESFNDWKLFSSAKWLEIKE